MMMILVALLALLMAPSSSLAFTLSMGGSSGVATTRAGKDATIQKVSSLLSESSLIFSIPSSSIPGGQVTSLRKALPEGCTARVVKNTLMLRAIEGSDFAAVSESQLAKGENMWFFCDEEAMGPAIKALEAWLKEQSKAMQASHAPRHGVMDGQALNTAAVQAIANLPTKQDLYQKIAISIKQVPTKLGRGIKQVPTKLARGIKLAKAEE